jgi:succinate dehydrogenase / fumarate reductase cytochrome b subunit
MAVDTNKPATSNWWKWFDPRNRDLGTWAFILNRITAIGLTVYLFLHLAVLFLLSQGPDAYDSFLELAKNPVIIFGELLVIIAGIYHGLNGVRIGLTTFADTSPYQKVIFYIFFVITVVGSMIFAVRMFTA